MSLKPKLRSRCNVCGRKIVFSELGDLWLHARTLRGTPHLPEPISQPVNQKEIFESLKNQSPLSDDQWRQVVEIVEENHRQFDEFMANRSKSDVFSKDNTSSAKPFSKGTCP